MHETQNHEQVVLNTCRNNGKFAASFELVGMFKKKKKTQTCAVLVEGGQ